MNRDAEQWEKLCDEHSAVHARTLDAMKRAFDAGWLTGQGEDEISRAAEAETEVRKRMAEFMQRCG